MGVMGPVEIIVILAITIIPLIFFWRIFAKAGYTGALALLLLIPLVNLIALGFLAFAEWPIERELKQAGQS